MNRIMGNVLAGYAGAGVSIAAATAYILIKEKETPIKIAGYTVINGLLWPAAIYAANTRAKDLLKLERLANGE